MALVAAGDAAAFQVLALRHTPVVLALARRMLGNGADAQDVAQETLLRLWRQAARWDASKGAARSWLLRIAANLCIDRSRRRRFWRLDEADEVADPSAGAEAGLLDAEARARVAAAVASLPARQRAAVALFYDAGLPGADVAAAVGMNEAALWQTLRRARLALATSLGDLLK